MREMGGSEGPSVEHRAYSDEIERLIDLVQEDPRRGFTCSHGDGDGAGGIYEVPEGCVALPGQEAQLLCQHHRWSDGSFRGMRLIVDLSENGGWSRLFRERPDYYIWVDSISGEPSLVDYEGYPFDIWSDPVSSNS